MNSAVLDLVLDQIYRKHQSDLEVAYAKARAIKKKILENSKFDSECEPVKPQSIPINVIEKYVIYKKARHELLCHKLLRQEEEIKIIQGKLKVSFGKIQALGNRKSDDTL